MKFQLLLKLQNSGLTYTAIKQTYLVMRNNGRVEVVGSGGTGKIMYSYRS
jgi:hypothetical protein